MTVPGSRIHYRPTSSLRETDLSMPRRKPRSAVSSIVFRTTRLTRAVGLELRALRFLLKASWLFSRLAYEICSSRIGPEFETTTRGVTAELLERHIPAGATVLDLGCGGGRLTRMAAPFSGRVTGVDLSAANIARAVRDEVPSNVEYQRGDAIAFAAGRHHDVVLLVHVLEHIDDADALLRTLSEQASLIIVEVPNFEADALNSVRLSVGLPFFSDADHVREYTAPILRDQLERNGLTVVEEQIRGASIIAVARKK
jgi:SAM-dependent methyltransferase